MRRRKVLAVVGSVPCALMNARISIAAGALMDRSGAWVGPATGKQSATVAWIANPLNTFAATTPKLPAAVRVVLHSPVSLTAHACRRLDSVDLSAKVAIVHLLIACVSGCVGQLKLSSSPALTCAFPSSSLLYCFIAHNAEAANT